MFCLSISLFPMFGLDLMEKCTDYHREHFVIYDMINVFSCSTPTARGATRVYAIDFHRSWPSRIFRVYGGSTLHFANRNWLKVQSLSVCCLICITTISKLQHQIPAYWLLIMALCWGVQFRQLASRRRHMTEYVKQPIKNERSQSAAY